MTTRIHVRRAAQRAGLAALLLLPLAARADSANAAEPGPPYGELYAGPRSEWVVAFGSDKSNAMSDKAPPDVSQYRGFKIFLERQGFKQENRGVGMDNTGLAVFGRSLKAPDGHDHQLTIKVLSSSLNAETHAEFTRTAVERRGYFSLSHTGYGIGLDVGGKFVKPEKLVESPASCLLLGAVACNSFDYFAGRMAQQLEQRKLPKAKLTYFGTTQDVELKQADGGFAVLKQIVSGAVAKKSAAAILQDAHDAYNPIMPFYSREASARNNDRNMKMDESIQGKPVLKCWAGGKTIELCRTPVAAAQQRAPSPTASSRGSRSGSLLRR